MMSHYRAMDALADRAEQRGHVFVIAHWHDAVVCDALVGGCAQIDHWVVVVSPDLDEHGRWRITWFDDLGPDGHTARDTRRECVEYACREFGRSSAVRPMTEIDWMRFQASWL